MKLNIAIIEDKIEESTKLKEYISTYLNEIEAEGQIDIYTGSFEFSCNYNGQYDVLFIDIELKENEQSGMELAHSIRKIDQNCVIVFVTNLSKYAVEGYQVNAFDFIVKPFTYESFKFRFIKIIERFNAIDERTLKIKSKGIYYKVNVDKIYYICVVNHTCYFYGRFSNNNTSESLECLETWLQMKTVEETINSENFVKCNPSYLINVKHINKIEKDKVIIGKTILPLSRNKKKSVIERYLEYSGD